MRLLVTLVLRDLRAALLTAVVVTAVSTIGFVVLADYPVFDALYMTIITLGTIGYGEVRPLDTIGRIWAMIVVVAGYGVLVNITARFTSILLSGNFAASLRRHRRHRMLERLHHHDVVIGFGRVGRSTAEAILATGRACAVVESLAEKAEEIERLGAVAVVGDARDVEVLEEAGIDRAESLVTTLDDPDNLVVVSSARYANGALRIVSRVNALEWSERLRRAGADDLVPVFRTAGRHLAASARSPGVVGVLAELGDSVTEEIAVPIGSPLVGRSFEDLMHRHPTVVVMGLRRDRSVARWHEVSGPIEAGDVLIARGPVSDLADISRPDRT